MELFNTIKLEDFKQIMKEYASRRLEFSQKALDKWQEILPLIEAIEID